MFYGDTVFETRKLFFDCWHKHQDHQTLSPLEQELLTVILAHPEYHHFLNSSLPSSEQTFYPELGQTNPFLHMGLHMAIREQIALNRPAGILPCYANLLKKHADPLEVEHIMMEQLAHYLWLAQKNNRPPNEQEYLMALNQLCEGNQ